MATLLAVCAVTAALLVGGATRAAGSDASVPADAGAAGTLELKTEPAGAEIIIDNGKSYGKTPGTTASEPTHVSLPAGQHQLTLRSPNPKEFKDRTLTITIVSGKPTRITLDLARVSPR